jgi:hypothetical protein
MMGECGDMYRKPCKLLLYISTSKMIRVRLERISMPKTWAPQAPEVTAESLFQPLTGRFPHFASARPGACAHLHLPKPKRGVPSCLFRVVSCLYSSRASG